MKTDHYRPKIHFSPRQYFVNDPNGLLHDGEKWHLFAQYLADSFFEGGKHWYHAVSRDLVFWEHLPIALSPDELGQIYSGSAVLDVQNTSGLGKDGKPPIVAMFTHHGASQQQSIAYSTDGVHFIKYPGNPVIPNKEKQHFRDPKIIWNPLLSCWTALIAAGDHVEFFASPDLLHWEKTGEFYGEHADFDGVRECPDLFPLRDEAGGEHWVLVLSLVKEWHTGKLQVCYYTGTFDGSTFIQNGQPPRRLDAGWDNYAPVSFFGAPEGQVILLGWNMTWAYFRYLPYDRFLGLFTLPRLCSLRRFGQELRLCQLPVSAIDAQFSPGTAVQERQPLEQDTFKIEIIAQGDFALDFFHENGPAFSVGLENDTLFLQRENCMAFVPDKNLRRLFSSSRYARSQKGVCHLTLYFDVCTCELFADEGSIAMTHLIFSPTPLRYFTLSGNARAVFAKG